MIISPLQILELNEKYGLVTGLGERDATNPEGVGFDLRVGKVEKIVGKSFLGVNKRFSPKTEVIGDVEKDGNKLITLRQWDYRLVTTMEEVYSPEEKVFVGRVLPQMYLMPDIHPRTSLQRGGVVLVKTKTDPGYRGKLTFGLTNLSEYDFEFELGARLFNLVFHGVVGELKRPYSGQHQGGRTTSQGETEVQT